MLSQEQILDILQAADSAGADVDVPRAYVLGDCYPADLWRADQIACYGAWKAAHSVAPNRLNKLACEFAAYAVSDYFHGVPFATDPRDLVTSYMVSMGIPPESHARLRGEWTPRPDLVIPGNETLYRRPQHRRH